MTNDQELFKDLDATYYTNVRIGNGAKLTVKGKGTIAIEGCTDLKLINDVLYVPEIDQNLLSVGQLLEKGYKVLFEDKTCMIKDSDNKELFRVKIKGKSFALDLIDKEQFVVHKVEDNMQVQGLPQLEEKSPICATLQYGKQTRLPFLKDKSWRATNKLQDVKGPKRTPSLNDKKVELVGIKVGESQIKPEKLEEENEEKSKEQLQIHEKIAEDCKDVKTKQEIVIVTSKSERTLDITIKYEKT
ncbi:uncharacterized protein LOC124841741 [Vigna umbellata]|uniref:uncharacterized protein LOC124841741 n=1 Tax=Vigna umbellata TaxID=87088 RepID=UPI001F5F75BE|nr:uncharacterized protein LOC124841741 [Vigna umbellata]